MTKSEIKIKLEKLYAKPLAKLHEKVGGSRPNIWKWWNDPKRSSKNIEDAALELIEEGELAKDALEAVGVNIKL